MKETWKKVTAMGGDVFYLDLTNREVWSLDDGGTLYKLAGTTDAFYKFRPDLIHQEDVLKVPPRATPPRDL